MKIPQPLDESVIKSIDYDSAMVASGIQAAADFIVQHMEAVPQTPLDVTSSGGRFIIPVAIPEEASSGDERSFKKNSITIRDLPLPLMWQLETGDGHAGAVVVGRIDSIDRIENGLGNARGVFDVGAYGREAERMVRGGFLRGVSADLDKFEAVSESEDEELSDKNAIKNQKIVVDSARLMGITIVPKPAFQECYIIMEPEPTFEVEMDLPEDGIFEEVAEDYESQIAAIAASAAPEVPPKQWFADPKLRQATPLTVTDDGRVFGHIAAWATSHIGLRNAVKPPRSASQYAYFRTGELRTDEGDVQVGQLTLAGGHANLQASASEAIKHYDDTQSAVADVTAGEDSYGIWVAGSIRPEVTSAQLRAFRASAPSGDWRPINGRLELVAVCSVNVPGFPVARAITASGGVPGALVAAGAAYLAEIKELNKMEDLESRLTRIENTELSAEINTSRGRMQAIMDQKNAELSMRADNAKERMASLVDARNAELSSKLEELKARFNS